MTLPEFLQELSMRRWEWSRTDCLMALSDWVLIKRGIDPAEAYRGAYSTEAECEEILKAHGGIRRIMNSALRAHNFERTKTPVAGDVGLVRAPVRFVDGRIGRGLAGGICAAPERWAVLTSDRGLVIAPLVFVAAWSI